MIILIEIKFILDKVLCIPKLEHWREFHSYSQLRMDLSPGYINLGAHPLLHKKNKKEIEIDHEKFLACCPSVMSLRETEG